MIQYIQRKDLDIKKYDSCIQNSLNPRIYALSDYLDIVVDHWDAIVFKDYQAVMPIPWRSKYLIKYIYPPCWTQQLGVFSIDSFDANLIGIFLKAIPKKFLKTTLQFNNKCSHEQFTPRTNFVLKLNKSYQNIQQGYKKNRKDGIKKFIKSGYSIQENINIVDVIDLFKENYANEVKINFQDYAKLQKLTQKKKLQPITFGVLDESNHLVSGSVFFKDEKRIYYVFSANNNKGNKVEGNTAILNHMIASYSNSGYTLDFEGSMHPGIASFFKSFGSVSEIYYEYTRQLF